MWYVIVAVVFFGAGFCIAAQAAVRGIYGTLDRRLHDQYVKGWEAALKDERVVLEMAERHLRGNPQV